MTTKTCRDIIQEILPGGTHWSLLMRAGYILQLEDLEGGANVGMLMYNPIDRLERYNAPDTLKCQHTFRLGKGNCLYSDMGRIFCSVIEDTVGWHDTVGGALDDHTLQSRWGYKDYQHHRNNWTISGIHAFLVELAKYGMNRRDLAANINWFSRVYADDNGRLHFDSGNSHPGAMVRLRFEMDTLVLFHTCPHPMNTSPTYPKKPVRYSVFPPQPGSNTDLSVNTRIENQRGLYNTSTYISCQEASAHDC